MQKIFLFLILFSIVYAQYHAGTHFKKSISNPKVHEEIHKHTHNASLRLCPKFDDGLKKATEESAECLHKKYNPEQQNLCNLVITELKLCLKPVISLLKSCLPEKSKETPVFLVDSLVNLIKFTCKANGSEILELSQPCITFTASDTNNTCRLMDYQDDFPTKTELCKFEASYRNCLKEYLERECHSTVTIDNFIRFYDVFYEPCKTIH